MSMQPSLVGLSGFICKASILGVLAVGNLAWGQSSDAIHDSGTQSDHSVARLELKPFTGPIHQYTKSMFGKQNSHRGIHTRYENLNTGIVPIGSRHGETLILDDLFLIPGDGLVDTVRFTLVNFGFTALQSVDATIVFAGDLNLKETPLTDGPAWPGESFVVSVDFSDNIDFPGGLQPGEAVILTYTDLANFFGIVLPEAPDNFIWAGVSWSNNIGGELEYLGQIAVEESGVNHVGTSNDEYYIANDPVLADGFYIFSNGAYANFGWLIATIPANKACPADLAEPFGGILNLQDVFAYLDLYNAQNPEADLAEPLGVFNLQDVFGYLDLFNAGCGM